jgi:hypothetical protein
MISYKDVEQKALGVIKGFFTMGDKPDDEALKLTIGELGLSGSVNMYDPLARHRALCQELKTAFLTEDKKLPALHLDLDPELLVEKTAWTIKQLIKRISRSLHSLTKENVR